MKRLILFSLLFIFSVNCFSQSIRNDYYYSVGFTSFNKFSINEQLAKSNLKEMQPYSLSASIVGVNRYIKKWQINAAFQWGFNSVSNQKANKMTNLKETVRVGYKLFDKKNVRIYTGADVSFYYFKMLLSSSSNTIDLNNINPSTQAGLMELYDNVLFAGPFFSIDLFSNEPHAVRILVHTGHTFYDSKWSSVGNSTVTNAVSEKINSIGVDLIYPLIVKFNNQGNVKQ